MTLVIDLLVKTDVERVAFLSKFGASALAPTGSPRHWGRGVFRGYVRTSCGLSEFDLPVVVRQIVDVTCPACGI